MVSRRHVIAAALLFSAMACVPSPGPFRLASAEGSVRDRDDGRPIPDAWIVQWYRGGGVPGASQPEYHARFSQSDAQGSFRFESALAPSPRMWVLRTYGPSYSFFHPQYGLLHRGVSEEPGPVELSASRADAELRMADLQPFCRGEREGPGASRLAQIACPDRR